MATYTVTRPLKRSPSHPGLLMREILDDHVRLPIATAARRMGVSRPALYAVLTGKSTVTADMALRFATLVQGDAELYLQMQARHDLWRAQAKLSSVLPGIERAEIAA